MPDLLDKPTLLPTPRPTFPGGGGAPSSSAAAVAVPASPFLPGLSISAASPVRRPRLPRVNLFTLANKLTATRLVLSVVIFGLLAACEHVALAESSALLNVAFGVFVLATITDMLDGWVARRMNDVSVFGRVMDPFVDKVMVCGGLALLAGGSFWVDGRSVTGLSTWMVALVLTREFLVTGLRTFNESQGVNFEAGPAGKAKMVLQSAVVGWLLFALANLRDETGRLTPGAYAFGVALIWSMVAATAYSGAVYLERARQLIREYSAPEPEAAATPMGDVPTSPSAPEAPASGPADHRPPLAAEPSVPGQRRD
jgi:CDP-diacylglycerol--glycerol-3-phosphate 3-phosphatidyltransferase